MVIGCSICAPSTTSSRRWLAARCGRRAGPRRHPAGADQSHPPAGRFLRRAALRPAGARRHADGLRHGGPTPREGRQGRAWRRPGGGRGAARRRRRPGQGRRRAIVAGRGSARSHCRIERPSAGRPGARHGRRRRSAEGATEKRGARLRPRRRSGDAAAGAGAGVAAATGGRVLRHRRRRIIRCASGPDVRPEDLLAYPWILPPATSYMVGRLHHLLRAAGLPPPVPSIETDVIPLKFALMRDNDYLSYHAAAHLASARSRLHRADRGARHPRGPSGGPDQPPRN